MDRYANIVIGQMGGHTHEDTYQVIRSSVPGQMAGVAFIHPSLTSSYDVLPSYRVYEMHPISYNLLDYEQYRFNTTQVNIDDKPVWTLSYKMREYYGLKDIEDRTLWKLAELIKVNDEYFKKFAIMIFAEGPRSIAFQKRLDVKGRAYCWLTCSTVDQSEQCLGYGIWNGDIVKVFLPGWEYAIYD